MKNTQTIPSGRYVVFSNAQGDDLSLKNFLEVTEGMRKKGYICLGDVSPAALIHGAFHLHEIRKKAPYFVRGNHEQKFLNDKETREELPEAVSYLKSLPEVIQCGDVLMYHSSLAHPGGKLLSPEEIQEEYRFLQAHYPSVRVALFGHGRQRVFCSKNGVLTLDDKVDNALLKLDSSALTLINPGGIRVKYYGLRQSFGLIDFDENTFRFLNLKDAERMYKLAGIVWAFEEDFMPHLNKFSYSWFSSRIKNDLPHLRKIGESNEAVMRVAEHMAAFDMKKCLGLPPEEKTEYLDRYSLKLAQLINVVRMQVCELYSFRRDPIEAWASYRKTAKKVWYVGKFV
jgi:predicted phosphodiesterase